MVKIKSCTYNEFPVQDNLFQSSFWGRFKNFDNQKSLFFFAEYNGRQFPLMLFLRNGKGRFTYAYAPKAPSVSIMAEERGIFLEELSIALKESLPSDVICIRYDLAWKDEGSASEDVRNELLELRMNFGTTTSSLRKSPLDHLCTSTVIINLTYSPEQLLSRMRQTTRNCVRRAYRSDITFTRYNAEQALVADSPLKTWHDIYKDTAERKSFYYEEYKYFERLFRLSTSVKKEAAECCNKSKSIIPLEAPAPCPKFFLLTANRNGKMLSGLVMAVSSQQAYYMYAGSSLEGRELMPNYGLQWEAQLFARRCGCKKYDLMGIPPNADSNHPMHGLYIFKTGFGGDKVQFPGCWDFVYDFDSYKTFTAEEQLSF